MSIYFDKTVSIMRGTSINDFGKTVPNHIADIKCSIKHSRQKTKKTLVKGKQEEIAIYKSGLEITTDFEIKPKDVVVFEGKEYELYDVVPFPSRYKKTFWVGYA